METQKRMTQEQELAVSKLITGLASDLKETVTNIEKKFATTQNRYGDYMSLIGSVAKDKKMANLISLALIQAGANKQGVISAMLVLYS